MRKRSSYRQKAIRADNMGWLMAGFAPVREHGKAMTLKIRNHQALASMTAGAGCREDIDILIAAMNIAEALAITADLGSEYRAEITAAQDAIVSMGKRGLDKGRFLFTGPELTAMNLGMEVHDAQLDACTVAQLERAMDFVVREITARRARSIA